MGFGSFVKRAATAVSTGGLSELAGGSGGAKDLLFGKKDPGVADRNVMLDRGLYDLTQKIRPMQSQSADLYKKRLDEIGSISSGGLADLATKRKVTQLGAAAKDAERVAGSQVARRGLGRSAVGLNAILNAGNPARLAQADARAMTPILKMQMGAQRDNQLMNVNRGLAGIIGSKDQSRAFVQGRESTGRTGGLAGILGGAAGAYFGGPQGAMAGFNMGNSLGNLQLG